MASFVIAAEAFRQNLSGVDVDRATHKEKRQLFQLNLELFKLDQRLRCLHYIF